MNTRSIAVFCGSKSGNNPVFTAHAAELGCLIGKNNMTLVYGGGSRGIMGTLADAVMRHGGKVTGVIPKKLIEWEHQHNGISQLLVTDDMHTRKKMMYELCDFALILPGGFGTLDELFEMLTWNQLAIHNKQIFILNSGNFYSHLINHIRRMEEEGFLYEPAGTRITFIDNPQQLVPFISQVSADPLA